MGGARFRCELQVVAFEEKRSKILVGVTLHPPLH